MHATLKHIKTLLERDLSGIKDEINAYPDQASVWATPEGISNSAGVLAMHGCGNLNHFVGHILGGNGYVRDRNLEFSNQNLTQEEICRVVDSTIAMLESTLSEVNPDKLTELFPEKIGGHELNTQLFLLHLCTHLSFHLGQIGYLRRVLTKSNASTNPLSISGLLSVVLMLFLLAGCGGAKESDTLSSGMATGNPIMEGWYADPEGMVLNNEYWIFPTYSARYENQVFFDAFSSPDLTNWTKHPQILDTTDVKWAWRAMWAPSVVEKDNRFYFFFGANDIQSDDEEGGIGVAVADSPGGPYSDYLGKPLIDKFHNGAQPIDQFAFKDGDDYYLFYGGWRHANVAKLNQDFTGFIPFEDGTVFREITPEGYVEGPFMLKRNGKYYFMWSEGGWGGDDYRVAYAISDSPFGPFNRIGVILEQDPAIATGAGHHSVIQVPNTDEWYIVYHRRPIPNEDRDHRVTAIDRLEFNEDGTIQPVIMTHEGVLPRPLQ